MRKFLLALGVVAMISGCATTNKADMKTVHQMPNKMQTIIFTDVNNPTIKLVRHQAICLILRYL